MPSRISGACNACRSKKQKCSGERPDCAQCVELGQQCTWPEQRKRGPAKGYIDGLEHRLHEAEQLLLQVLPFVTNEQLALAATNNLLSLAGTASAVSPETTPPLLNNKTGVKHWEQFPLDSIENIRRWQHDCATVSGLGKERHRSLQSVSDKSENSSLNRSASFPTPLASLQHFQTDPAGTHFSFTDTTALPTTDQWPGLQPPTSMLPSTTTDALHTRSSSVPDWALQSFQMPTQQQPQPQPQPQSQSQSQQQQAQSQSRRMRAPPYPPIAAGTHFFSADDQKQFFW